MLLGTTKVSSSSVAFVSSTAENQRLKVSALTCGLSAADNFSQRALHLSSIQVVNRGNGRLQGRRLRGKQAFCSAIQSTCRRAQTEKMSGKPRPNGVFPR